MSRQQPAHNSFQLGQILAFFHTSDCQLAPALADALIVAGSEKHDWQPRSSSPNPLGRLEPAEEWHVQVENCQIELFGLGELRCLPPVASQQDPVALVL